jgi:uncharacterized membrane protein
LRKLASAWIRWLSGCWTNRMEELTGWRTEAWHPLTVHFPVAFLLFATVAKLVALLLKPDQGKFWDRMGSYLLYLGCLAAWISIYTGDMADGIVSRKLCDPTVLKSHEMAAYNLAYLFTGAVGLNLIRERKGLQAFSRIIAGLVLMLMLAGSSYLIYTGHLGARLVYEQAGGVSIPPADCAGF